MNGTLSLAPGFSRVSRAASEAEPFQRFGRPPADADAEKPLKRLSAPATPNTRLKPGANESAAATTTSTRAHPLPHRGRGQGEGAGWRTRRANESTNRAEEASLLTAPSSPRTRCPLTPALSPDGGEGVARRHSSARRCLPHLLFPITYLLLSCPAHAARIGDISETTLWDQALRFFTFQDPAVRYALLGSMLLGISCGLLGSFLVVRKMALVGDALSHAVLPGVALGFLWNMSKDPVAIFIGATLAGLLGTAVVNLLKQTTRLKEDTALGLVLAAFFAVGICLLTMIQRLPSGNKSGIDKFLFGQAAAIGAADVQLMAVVTGLAVVVIATFYKEFLVTSFDAGFARAAGLPVQVFHYGLMLLLAFAVVIALQAVGVVLVSAMLITPAAAAYLLTDRMHRMLLLAALFGMAAGALGAFLSFLGNNLPTGPFMVLAATAVFAGAFLFGPRHGIVARWWRQRSRTARTQRENTLKAIYHVLEARGFQGEGVSLRELAERRRETLEDVSAQAAALRAHGLATLHDDATQIFVTPDGWQRACAIVRNHRLWELYLTNEARVAADHVHEDAEKIEHVLGEETVRDLERRLAYATTDPHGRAIPSLSDMRAGTAPTQRDETVGFGKGI